MMTKENAGKTSLNGSKKKKLTKKQTVKIHNLFRFAIQLLFFIFLPSAYSSAYAGIKYIFTKMGTGELIEITAFIRILLLLLIYTAVFGRFFCGFSCAFGSLGDWVYSFVQWVLKKMKKKPRRLPERLLELLPNLKYLVLGGSLLMCFFGKYGMFSGTNPWDVFSMLHALTFRFDRYAAGLLLFLLILIGMAAEERFFCKFLCPMGAVFSLVPVLTPFSLRRNRPACLKKCSACSKVCPSRIGLPNDGELKVEGDCFQCQKCIGVCPKANIHCGMILLKGDEYWFTAVRALLLAGLMVYLGV
ncbi:MAG: 4Fe-4S binding protein [Bacteroidales bacterium]|nr:4Fe-4S binding protein [Bacteroidales bacterium]